MEPLVNAWPASTISTLTRPAYSSRHSAAGRGSPLAAGFTQTSIEAGNPKLGPWPNPHTRWPAHSRFVSQSPSPTAQGHCAVQNVDDGLPGENAGHTGWADAGRSH